MSGNAAGQEESVVCIRAAEALPDASREAVRGRGTHRVSP